MSEKGTEKASPQKKKKARESGDIVRSRELLSAVSLLFAIYVFGLVDKEFFLKWMTAYRLAIAFPKDAALSDDAVVALLREISILVFPCCALVLGACWLGVLFSGAMQGGGIGLHFNALRLKTDRLNPLTNLKNLLGVRSIARIGKSIVPASIMAWVGWKSIYKIIFAFPVLGVMRMPAAFETAYHLVVVGAWISFAWSSLDYLAEWHSWNARLRMTKQELKEESKEASGNPLIKSRVRQIQRLMRRRRIKADIARASVVITNPTHYAVALMFSFETMQAPTVLAKGRGLQASEIREEARWAGVPLIENPPLARTLYRSVDPGQSIPFELYQAVAAILAFLYRQRVEEKLRREQRTREVIWENAALSGTRKMQSVEGGM